MIRFERHKTNDLKEGNRNVRSFFEHHNTARVILGGIAIFGVCLIISDGILTPAQSVLGAIQGLFSGQPTKDLRVTKSNFG
jgi:KUP system potassium uptake protein